MNKKWMAAAFLAVCLSGGASAMDSATLLKDPKAYPVIYATEAERVYVDMKTLQAMQTMDLPGSLENMSFTMYVETYKEDADAFDFARGKLVTRILEYAVDLSADRMEKHYEMTKHLRAVYDVKGKNLGKDALKEETEIAADAKNLYYNLARLPRVY